MNYCTGEMDIAAICFNCESDGCKWEWGNCYENDGTPDNSIWTSIETDGILETSPSVNQNFDESTYNEQEEVEDQEDLEALSVSGNDPVTCVSCKYDSKKMETTCFNGI